MVVLKKASQRGTCKGHVHGKVCWMPTTEEGTITSQGIICRKLATQTCEHRVREESSVFEFRTAKSGDQDVSKGLITLASKYEDQRKEPLVKVKQITGFAHQVQDNHTDVTELTVNGLNEAFCEVTLSDDTLTLCMRGMWAKSY